MLGHEYLDIAHELLVQRRGAANGQGEAVNDKRITLGEPAEFLAQGAAHVDPVLRRDFHEVDLRGRVRHQLVGNRPAQAETGAAYGIL